MNQQIAAFSLPGLTTNHNQTIVRPQPGIWPNHNQTIVRAPFGWSNHNQTLVGR